MLVFKFGGASVKDADAIRNVSKILSMYDEDKIVVVVSAMGKTTSKLEDILKVKDNDEDTGVLLEELTSYHDNILQELFREDDEIYQTIDSLMEELKEAIENITGGNKNLEYDKIVSFGELLSTSIVNAFLLRNDFKSEWMDVRNVIKTDGKHKGANVIWGKCKAGAEIMKDHLQEDQADILVTQGFIGSSPVSNTTTLGREGSDFSAAILAYLIDAEKVIIWKDVPGMLNADPKWFNNTVKLDAISYREAIELSYYGASVIHPNTIKPLQNKGIPLHLKSFSKPLDRGSVIQESMEYDSLVPSYIFKDNQILISISPKDFSFIVEENMSDIFQVLSDLDININLMQNSAINFSLVINNEKEKIDDLIDLLSSAYKVRYNEGLKLLTIRHYEQEIVNQLTANNEILLQQSSRNTKRLVLREV